MDAKKMVTILWSIVNTAGVNCGFVNIDDESEQALRMAISIFDPDKKILPFIADYKRLYPESEEDNDIQRKKELS